MRWRLCKESPRYLVSSCGKIWDTYRERYLSTHLDKGGYVRCSLEVTRKNWKMFFVHRLVANNYLNTNALPVVNHIDGNKLCNDVSNLEWCTIKENNIHAYQKGLKKARKGEEHYEGKLTEKDVIVILSLRGIKYQREVAEMFNVSQTMISSIYNKRTWKHIN